MRSERHVTPHGAMWVWPDIAQGSEAWDNLRRGFATASNFSRIVTAQKCELSKQAVGLMHELIGDCIHTGLPPKWTGNTWTDRGIECEPEARAAFEAATGLEVSTVGFCAREDRLTGCSPDGLILHPDTLEFDEGLEIKCPSPGVHVSYVAGGVLPDAHFQQVHGSLAVTGLRRWHFWSWIPGMKPFHVIVERDSYTEKLSAALDGFVVEYLALRAKIIPKLRLENPEPRTE